MSTPMSWIFIIPLIPAAAFVALVALPRRARNAARFVALAAIALAFLASAAALIHLLPGHEMGEPLARFSWTLATVGSRALTITLGADSLGILMLAMVSLVGTCVQVYSLFYMKDDERRGWFFCVMSLFLSAMLTFVLSANLLLQFAMWEIMGVCSYLLIGFWYTDEAPRKASQKAFLVTRTGDVGFFVGLAAIFAACDSFEFEHIYATAAQWSPFL
ncbi:MAG: NADH-quinone oxidoreductase subunit L, partial [Actinomycetes bacterium]|nr:NADH-quinone oxidoreductase subunit L [Actinomycetes bacterium]